MNEDLRKWFKEKWVDISRKKKGGGHPPCGASADKGVRAKDSSKKYPKCVPANKAKNMSKKQKKSAVTRKRRAPNEPGSPDNVRTDIKKESWESWKPRREKVYPGGAPSNNAPENPEPMGGAVAFERSRQKVLADLNEMIRHLVQEVLKENTLNDTAIRIIKARLRRAFADTNFPVRDRSGDGNDLETIAETYVDIMEAGQAKEFIEFIEEIPENIINAFNSAVEAIPNGSEDYWIRKAVAKFGNMLDLYRERQTASTLGFGGTFAKVSDEFQRRVDSYKEQIETASAAFTPNQRAILLPYITYVRSRSTGPFANESEEAKLNNITSAIAIESGRRPSSANPDYERFRRERGRLNEMIKLLINKVLKEGK